MLEALDATLLARLQFAFTVSFHFIFPSFSIGLASYLAVLEALWLWTGRQVYLDPFKYWLKIFALAFGMGVVSGIVTSYQFGTNWWFVGRRRRRDGAGRLHDQALAALSLVLPGLESRQASRARPCW